MRISSSPFPSQDRVVIIDYHGTGLLNCSAEGSPSPLLFMSHDGRQMSNATMKYFSSATERDNGEYCCIAFNLLGRKKACLTVSVDIDVSESQKRLIVGVTIGCILVVILIAVIVCAIIRFVTCSYVTQLQYTLFVFKVPSQLKKSSSRS